MGHSFQDHWGSRRTRHDGSRYRACVFQVGKCLSPFVYVKVYLRLGNSCREEVLRLYKKHGTSICFWWGPLPASAHGGRPKGADMCRDHMARERRGRFQVLFNNQLSQELTE